MNNEQNKPVTQFYSAHGDALTPEQVEDEVLEAVTEGKEATVDVKQQESIVDEKEFTNTQLGEPWSPKEKTNETKADTTLEVIKQKTDRAMLRRLRLRDTISKNKTCSQCLSRVPLNKIHGGHADVCDNCKG